MKKMDPLTFLEALKKEVADADLGVAFRADHGMSREDWIAKEVAGGATPASAKDACRKMANAALVGHLMREREHQMAVGRAYRDAGERNKIEPRE